MKRRTSRILAVAACCALIFLSPVVGAVEISDEDLELFESRIRPVLAERCYACHGADSKKIRGGLVLLDAESLRAGGDSGAVLVPGRPEESLLIEAIRYDGLTQMPPDGKLSTTVIADFERWIARGAPDPREDDTGVVATKSDAGEDYDYTAGREHWAFRAIARPPVPTVENESWVTNDIDRFVLAKLESEGLDPVDPATKRQLLRRVSFDLVGLPPSEEEIEAFLGDDSPDAYRTVVERLLASPHYGERWARHWLDVARYADSNGLDENIAHRNAFRYRDYVIDALNDDKPFDRFVTEQIAGDLMPEPVSGEGHFERLTATGFLMMGAKVLAERDIEKMLIDIVDEQVNVIGRAFLAEPIGCARCHDHKFDPIPTADYYAMAGILRSTRTMSSASGMRWVERPLAPEDVVAGYEAHRQKIADAEEKVAEVVDEEDERLRNPRRERFAGYLLAMEEIYPHRGDGEEMSHEATTMVGRIAERDGLEVAVLGKWVDWFHHFRTTTIQGDAPNPNVVFEIWQRYADASPDRYEEVTQELRADIASEKVLTAPLTRSLVLRGPAPRTLEEVAWRYSSLISTIEIAWEQHLMRLAYRKEPVTPGDYRLPREQEELRRLVYGSPFLGFLCIVCLDAEEEEALYSEEAKERLVELRAAVEALEEASPPEPPYTMAVEEGEIADLPVHIRGSHLNLATTPTPRGFLKVTDHLVPPPPIDEGSSGRLELARWITHPEHPLTSRVIVNRVWHWHFGRGLVDTPSNFGITGSQPTHPELLDYLARRFVENGWSIKDLHREILLTSTYRLSTAFNEANAAKDEDNRLLWRMNRQRLEVEPLRDTLLALSGRLDLTMGGRVDEYNPRRYVFSEGSTFGDVDFYTAPRRSIYMPVVRNAIYNVFAGFDFGDASDSVGSRPATVVPPQALLMMNSDFVLEQAEGFAERILEEEKKPRDRVDLAFVRAYGRPATDVEIDEAVDFVAEMMRTAPEGAEKEPFAWTRLTHVIMASSEFQYID